MVILSTNLLLFLLLLHPGVCNSLSPHSERATFFSSLKTTKSIFETLISDFGQKVRLPKKQMRGSRFVGSRNVIVGRLEYLKKGRGVEILGQGERYFPLARDASPPTQTGFTKVPGGWKGISGKGKVPFPLPEKVVKICRKMQVSKSAGLVGKTFVHSVRVVCAP